METLEFRPPYAVRAVAASIGLLCLIAALHQLWLALSIGEYARIPVVLLLSLPIALAATLNRRRIALDESGILVQTSLSSARIPYSVVRRVDERRSGLIIETSSGPITAAWLTRSDRERLLRAIVERARLIRSIEEPPYGIRTRYVPRAKEISFIPHHARKQPDSGDSGNVVS